MAMKRVTRSSKKRDESIENDPFMFIPLELIVEILMKLPPRSIARLCFASTHLSSIITGNEFTDLYMARSSTQPLYLYSVYRLDYYKMQLFHSCSQEDPSDSDHHDDMVSSTLAWGLRYLFTPPIRGLILGRNYNEIMIGNPNTSQFVSLPKFKTSRKVILYVLGYDPVNDLYKVLCITEITKPEAIMKEEHQVITVGSKQKWRMIECKYPHRHYPVDGTQAICRDGVVYYLASYKKKLALMSFHLSSEEFKLTKLPEDYDLQKFAKLVNHTGKITITTQVYYGPFIDLWVLEDTSKEVWSKAATSYFVFQGVLRTGEIIFQPSRSPSPLFFLCYDPKEKNVRKVVIEGIGDGYIATRTIETSASIIYSVFSSLVLYSCGLYMQV